MKIFTIVWGDQRSDFMNTSVVLAESAKSARDAITAKESYLEKQKIVKIQEIIPEIIPDKPLVIITINGLG